MVDKIYSRPRIRVKKMKKRQKVKLIIMIVVMLIMSFVVFIIRAAYPVFVASCENAATSSATNILNKEVNEVMLVYNYSDLVNLGKDEERKNNLYRSKNYAH